MKLKKLNLFNAIFILNPGLFFAQQANDTIKKNKEEKWSYHFQFTGVMQGHPSFHAPYAGPNSLSSEKESAFSVTSTFYLGRKLWKGASVYFNPEIAGGSGIGRTLGIAGFTNGECFRVADASPALYSARLFLRQHIALGQSDMETAESDANQIGGEKIPSSRITITAGHFSIADVFDNNSYSHDPRTQFLNWGLMNNGAWDYPANTRGYTNGFIVELIKPGWAVRVSETMVPKKANGPQMDENIGQARGETVEFEKRIGIKKHKGAVRFLAFRNLSHSVSYQNTIALYTSGIDTTLNVNSPSVYGGQKYGFALNADQELTDDIGMFARASWNDGKSSTWAFTEIDQSASIGISIKGSKWKRPDDVIGIAGLINGISSDHADFLNYGGYGFMLGDGKLTHYGGEKIGEIYYSIKLADTFWLSADYQYVMNPAYNRDRGPVNVWAFRGHVKF